MKNMVQTVTKGVLQAKAYNGRSNSKERLNNGDLLTAILLSKCRVCTKEFDEVNAIGCDRCSVWTDLKCSKLPQNQFDSLIKIKKPSDEILLRHM